MSLNDRINLCLSSSQVLKKIQHLRWVSGCQNEPAWNCKPNQHFKHVNWQFPRTANTKVFVPGLFILWLATMSCSVCSQQNYLYGQSMLMLQYIAKTKHLLLPLLSSLDIYTAPLPAVETSSECFFSGIFNLKYFFFFFFSSF